MSDRTTSAAWVQGIVDALSATGLDVQAMCVDAAIEWNADAASAAAWPTEQISLLWQLAVARSGDPAIAFAAAERVRPAILGAVGYAMMSSATLSAALERLLQYMRILSSAATAIWVTEDDGDARITFDLHGGGTRIPRQRVEFDLLAVLTFCSWVVGHPLQPVSVDLTDDTPLNVQPYLQAFRCMPRFNARSNSVRLARADLQSPLSGFDPQLAALHDRLVGARVEALDKPVPLHAQQVRDLVARRLPDGEPGRAAVARELRMTERTLQRRLRNEDTSFHAVVDITRRELAERHLAQPKLSLAEVADLLGFASQGNLTRACRRWFDMTPGQYRARVVAASTDHASGREA